MASQLLIQAIFQTGQSLYAVIRARVEGSLMYWNTTLNAGAGGFEAFNAGNWADYVIAMTEDSTTGYYHADYPETQVDEFSTEVIYISTGTPLVTDTALLMTQSQGASVAAIRGEASNAVTMEAASGIQVIGEIVTVTDDSHLVTNLDDTTDGVYIGRLFAMTSGDAIRQVAYISDYDGDTKLISLVSPLISTPLPGDTFVII